MTGMHWLPSPIDFRGDLKAAGAGAGAEEQLRRLAALALHRLSFIETIQLDNVARAFLQQPDAPTSRVRLAALGSTTMDHLSAGIRVAALRRQLLVDIHPGAFGQYRRELLEPDSPLHKFRPEIILISLDCRELIASLPLAASIGQTHSALGASIADLRSLWRHAKAAFGASVLQQNFLDVTEPVFGSYDRLVPGSPSHLVGQLNELLTQAAAEEGVMLLDVARASALDGLDAWFDVTRWLQGKIEISPQAAPMYGELVARVIAAQRGQSSKCLVLDLDNTLWGGVIGEVGLEGILLGQGSAVGEAHLDLQRYARSLKERGIMIAICSKNEPAIVDTAFNEHPEMLLRRADISAMQVNWQDKAENLRSIATQLNIGLDSLVFVDDNPTERARIRQSLPMVAVPELPEDPAYFVRCLARAGYFESIAFTQEDRQRIEQYDADRQRESLRGSFQSMDEFLRGLGMSMAFGPITPLEMPRAVQLINKTNQFNTTARRLVAEELTALTSDPAVLALQFRLNDRLGDSGLVSVLLLRRNPDEPQVFEVLNWVMSCRVFGRQLEEEIMNIAVERAMASGALILRAELIATSKNGVIKDLFRTLGFSAIAPPENHVSTHWQLVLADYAPRSTHIRRMEAR